MFRLHKTRASKNSGEKIDFKLSNFKLVQVPKGWDRLFMSIISMENGKTMAKTSKVVVRNGICQWTETLSESIWVSKTQMEDCFFKLVVAMGTSRSSILGEATVNMTGYVNSTVVVPVSLPLKKCTHGTILQVKIHCLTPRSKPMDNESKQTNPPEEGNSYEHPPNPSLNSDSPESLITKSDESSPSPDLVSATHQEELVTREASFSASDSYFSYDSAESSIGKESSSPVSHLNGDSRSLMEKQDSPEHGNPHVDNLSRSNHSSFVSQTSSWDHKQELHAEAKMWQRNAEKLTLDLDVLRKQYSDQSRNLASSEMELLAANAERDGLRNEVEQLKTLLETSTLDDGVTLLHKELENEIKFQKESNDTLALQLKRSQDANAELVSVLQELEQTIEKQRVELENTMQQNSEENRDLMIQFRQLRESEMNLQAKVELLEDSSHALLDIEEEYKTKLADKEREIVGLKVKLSESQKERRFMNPESRKGGDAHLIREIEALRAKLEELETDCNELTDENLELLLKFKESNNNLNGGVGTGIEKSEQKSEMLFLEEKLKKKIQREIQSDYNSYIHELESEKIELDAQVTEAEKEVAQTRTEIQTLEATLQSKEEENVELRLNLSKLQGLHDQLLVSENKCEYLRSENTKLRATNETLTEECNSFKKSGEELRNDKSELEKHCADLESKLRECSKKVEALEENLNLKIEDFATKEQSLTKEFDAIQEKCEKLELEESSWNRMYSEKTYEVENLRVEVENLAKNLSAAQHEKEKTAYDARCEVSGLQADKVALESALREAGSNLRLTESELKKTETKAISGVEDLLVELAALRKNHETLLAEHEKASKLLENYKSSEGKLKTIVNDLNLKLTVSEYERQQVLEQSNNIKVQYQTILNLQDDISDLRNERNVIKASKEELEGSLHLLSRECDDLKTEKSYFMQQNSTLQKVVSELEDCKHEKVVLEEKLARAEGNLAVNEALLRQHEEIENELNEIKQKNRLFKKQIEQLQEEKNELLMKTETLEEKQKQRHSIFHRNRREDNHYDSYDGSHENEVAKAMKEGSNKHRVRVTRLSEGQKSQSNTPRKSSVEGEVVAKERYESTKSSLEAELSDIRERYLQMSLKYAEVEAQREELVMKLRGVKSIRRWFSNPSN